MHTNREIIKFLKQNLFETHLHSFGIRKQFVELGFSNSKFEEIKFFIDCKISTSDKRINTLIHPLQDWDEDTFEIAYFINANRKYIVDCEFDKKGNFILYFNNDYDIIFLLDEIEDANLSITFREKENNEIYKAIDISPRGEVTW